MDDSTSEMVRNSQHVEEVSQLDTEDLLSTNENGSMSNRDVETDAFKGNEDDLKRDDYDQPEQTKESLWNSQERMVLEQHQLKSGMEEDHELSVDDNHQSGDVKVTDKTIQHSDETKKADDKIVESADSHKISKDKDMSKVTEMTEKTSVNREII